MNLVLRASYAAAGQAARLGAAILPAGSTNKLLRAITARRGIVDRYEEWGALRRDPDRRLVWIHAPSVGEGHQARPVIEWLRSHHPELQIAFTIFSPSAERFAATVPADFSDYLPFDVAGDARRALRALRPSAIVFSKLDVWPELCRAARAQGVPLGMISATVTPNSSRLGALSSALMRDTYAALTRVSAVADADAARLISIGVRAGAITVSGDTRYDQVWARARTAREAPHVVALRTDRPTLVAGSTWPSDDAVLFPAWSALRSRHRDARLIIAPHEPGTGALARVERWSAGEGLGISRLDAVDAGGADVVLVDRVGVLGDLYALATAAYVGGGFHGAGLHSVLEPAAFGAPVLFGPRHDAQRDAALLVNSGGAAVVSSSSGLDAALERWLYDGGSREAAGFRARELVQSGLGATERSGALIEELLISP